MNIRQAVSEDSKAIKKIADLLYIEMPDFVWNTEKFIKEQVERGEYYVAVFSDLSAEASAQAGALAKEEQIVGIASLRERNGMMYIETLAVAKDIRSKGVGSKLVEFAKQLARENGFKILRVTSFYEYGVKDFYIKHGFKLLDKLGEYSGHKFHRLDFELNE